MIYFLMIKFIWKINKITDLYITINDIQIPIIRNNLEQLIILYQNFI